MDITYNGTYTIDRDIMSGYWLDSVDYDWMRACRKNLGDVMRDAWARSSTDDEYAQYYQSKIVQYYIKQKCPELNRWLADNKIGFMGRLGCGSAHYPYSILLLLDKGSDNELAFRLKFKTTVVSQ